MAANPDHEAYFFCFDEDDDDVICAFQVFSCREAIERFMAGDWYSSYLAEVRRYTQEAPDLNPASPVWSKGEK